MKHVKEGASVFVSTRAPDVQISMSFKGKNLFPTTTIYSTNNSTVIEKNLGNHQVFRCST